MRSILAYAQRQGYTEYTSTLEEAWRISIQGLSETLVNAFDLDPEVTEFSADESFADDPVSAFAVLEAARHRERGISLPMFLGLFKYYRQSYLDRVADAKLGLAETESALFFVTRIFDRMEIAFCSAWAQLGGGDNLRALQDANRRMTNEKNRFLTVAESLGSPVLLFDEEGRILYANQAAAPLLGIADRPGSFYYSAGTLQVPVPRWLDELVTRANASRSLVHRERTVTGANGETVLQVRLHPMLDVSGKFEGTVAVIHDVTELRLAERALAVRANELEELSSTDSLTGLANRRGLAAIADGQLAIARRTGRPLTLMYADLNDLKQINDRHGHAAGDAALVAFATALRRTFRTADIVARIGGDEFVVVMPDQGPPEESSLTERIEQSLSCELARLDDTMRVSFSLGWASFDADRHPSLHMLIADADAAMYARKREHQGLGEPSPALEGTRHRPD